jgi:hypothetical protein
MVSTSNDHIHIKIQNTLAKNLPIPSTVKQEIDNSWMNKFSIINDSTVYHSKYFTSTYTPDNSNTWNRKF